VITITVQWNAFRIREDGRDASTPPERRFALLRLRSAWQFSIFSSWPKPKPP